MRFLLRVVSRANPNWEKVSSWSTDRITTSITKPVEFYSTSFVKKMTSTVEFSTDARYEKRFHIVIYSIIYHIDNFIPHITIALDHIDDFTTM
jgi:hypothetical protein